MVSIQTPNKFGTPVIRATGALNKLRAPVLFSWIVSVRTIVGQDGEVPEVYNEDRAGK